MTKIKYKENSYKKVPDFWWDFSGSYHIIVESDNPKFPVIQYFCYNDDANAAILLAEKLINDLKSGRQNLFYSEPLDECKELIPDFS